MKKLRRIRRHRTDAIVVRSCLTEQLEIRQMLSTTIMSGQTIAGTITTSGEQDTYTFKATAGETILANVGATAFGSEYSPKISVFAPNGNPAGVGVNFGKTGVDTAGGQTDSSAEVIVSSATAGTYTIVVEDFDGGRATYDLEVAGAPAAQAVDADGDGGTITSGQTKAGTINHYGDLDTYTFTATAGETIAADVGDATASSAYISELSVYGPNGSLTGVGQNSGRTGYETSGGVTKSSAEVVVSSAVAGTYTIVVQDDEGQEIGGTYDLEVAAAPAAQAADVDGDGGAITSGQTKAGTINHYGDLDTYTFTATAGDVFNVTVADATQDSTYIPELSLYGPSGNLTGVGQNFGRTGYDTSGGETDSFAEIEDTATSSGVYTVVVQDDDGVETGGTYGLSLNGTIHTGNSNITAMPATNQAATVATAKNFTIGSFSESNATAPYTVDINWGDGTADTVFAESAPGTIPAESHTYAASGNDTVSVVVQDSAGDVSNVGTFVVNVTTMTQPSSSITVKPPADQSAIVNALQSFALGSFSEVNATAPYTADVNWDDGTPDTIISIATPGTIPAQTHSFLLVGSDTVSVTVTDADSVVSNTATFNVTVPTPTILVEPAANQSATVGVSKSFSVGSFTEANDAGPYSVFIDFGDGTDIASFTVPSSGTIPDYNHTYAATGNYSVTVDVEDADGFASDSASFTANVSSSAVKPGIKVTAPSNQSATVGVSKSISLGSFTASNATAPYAVFVTWGDGSADTRFSTSTIGTLTAQSHTYAKAGSDIVSVTVTDANGNVSNKATFTVAVSSAVVASKATISGTVFKDSNGDGKDDDGETGLAGVRIYLDTNKDGKFDDGETSTTTSSTGSYMFTGLAAGTYQVREVTPSGYFLLSPAVGYTSVTAAAGTTSAGINFADEPKTGRISGYVFDDLNGNGKLDKDEPLLKSYEIYIDANKDGKYDSGDYMVTSNSSGYWSFGDLIAGTYEIRIVQPKGTTTTTAGGALETITLTVGQQVTGKLFGEKL